MPQPIPTCSVCRNIRRLLSAALLFAGLAATARAADEPPSASIEQQRMELMRSRTQAMTFRARDDDTFPERLQSEPLFRYDDLTRGYLDGTVWRLGAKGRPKAIITSELHPRYEGGQKIIYDFLSLSEVPFIAHVPAVSPPWSPSQSAVSMKKLPGAPEPAATAAKRLFQLRQQAARFTATQDVKEVDVERRDLELRLLPQPIDRYASAQAERADAAIFVFAAGRMPGLLLLIETDGSDWQWGVGRLSHPSTLTVRLDGAEVWKEPPAVLIRSAPYTATNAPAQIPGVE